MAGSIEHLITGLAGTIPRDAFTYLYRLINGYANTTVIASYYGFGGSGFGLSGDIDQSGENAWFAWEWNPSTTHHGKPVYGLAQWAFAEALGVHGGPAAGYGTFGLFLSFACAESGGYCWNGTANNNGADTKGTPVWFNGSQNVVPFPRSNSFGGAYETNREGMAPVCGFTTPSRCSFYLDDNSLMAFVDEANNGAYRFTVFQDIRSRVGHVVPLIMLCDNLTTQSLNTGADYGPLSPSVFREGGLAHPDPAQGTRSFRPDRHVFTTTAIMNPTVNGIYLAPRLAFNFYDAQGLGSYGPAGSFYELREMGNVATHTTFNGLTIAAYGGSTQSIAKICCHLHDGVTIPGTGVTAAGVQFGF